MPEVSSAVPHKVVHMSFRLLFGYTENIRNIGSRLHLILMKCVLQVCKVRSLYRVLRCTEV